jgi:predicted ATPase/signal transduction histidine kinase
MTTEYSELVEIYRSARTRISRARSRSLGQRVILKSLVSEFPTAGDIEQFRREFEIGASIDSRYVSRPIGFEEFQGFQTILFEDLGGESLKDVYPTKAPLSELFVIAENIVRAIADVHDSQVIHRDVNPSNVIVERETLSLVLIDFGISTTFASESAAHPELQEIHGTLSYISPEQTGRMRTSVDYRSDYYSLGVLLYRLLTGQLPFTTRDQMKLIHSHIAIVPEEPHRLVPGVPRDISALVMKLIEKDPSKRYQSATGILRDLRRCRERAALGSAEQARDFRPGVDDLSPRVIIPSNLYGRAQDIDQVLRSVSDVEEGRSRVVFIQGPAGMGKTSVIKEVKRTLDGLAATVVLGSFERGMKETPYAALIEAFQRQILTLLDRPAAERDAIKERILDTVGSNAALLIDVIPELERLIGPQPRAPELPVNESALRFQSVLERFVRSFVTRSRFLVIILDNLHWIDHSTSVFIQKMASHFEFRRTLLVGTYRESGLERNASLRALVDGLSSLRELTTVVELRPFDVGQATELIEDTFHRDDPKAQELAEVCCKKTRGNPLFFSQFLYSLAQDRAIYFKHADGTWDFDLAAIAEKNITENVIVLMVNRLQTLPEETMLLLSKASCVGFTFSSRDLAVIFDMTEQEVSERLEACVADEFLVHVDDTSAGRTYQFLHDRVQQASYSFLTREEREATHYTVALAMLSATERGEGHYGVFEIANQLNRAGPIQSDPVDRERLFELNLKAGQKAKDSASFDIGHAYLEKCISLIGEADWSRSYERTISTYALAVEAAFQAGELSRMDELMSTALARCRSTLDAVKIHEVKIVELTSKNRPSEAVRYALKILHELGVDFEESPSMLHVGRDLLKTRLMLARWSDEAILSMEELRDVRIASAFDICGSILTAAYTTTPQLFPIIVLKIIRLSLKHGCADETPFALSTYALITSALLGDIETGIRYGQLARRIVEDERYTKCRGKVYFVTISFLDHLKTHLEQSLAELEEGYKESLGCGDLEFAWHSMAVREYHLFFMGEKLASVRRSNGIARREFELYEDRQNARYLSVFQQAIFDLVTPERSANHFAGPFFDDATDLPVAIETKDGHYLGTYYFFRMFLAYLFDDDERAVEAAEAAKEHLNGIAGFFQFYHYGFVKALVDIRAWERASRRRKVELSARIALALRRFDKLARSCPENYGNKHALLRAEWLRATGRWEQSIRDYEDSIALASRHGFVHEEGLASELYGRSCIASGTPEIARSFLARAIMCYERWGAVSKVRALRAAHPELTQSSVIFIGSERTASSTTTSSQTLDLGTAIKASQIISQEIILESLMEKILSMVIENAGAQVGILTLASEDSFYVEASHVVSTSGSVKDVMQHIPMESYDDIAKVVVEAVYTSGKTVVLDDAVKSARFGHDAHIQSRGVKSIVCIPLVHQTKIRGALYLENNLMTGAFTRERIGMLEMLSGVMIISLENAQLYRSLEQSNKELERKVTERTSELLGKNDELATKNEEIDSLLINLNVVLENMVDGIVATRKDEEIVFANQAAEGLLDVPISSMAERPPSSSEPQGRALDIVFGRGVPAQEQAYIEDLKLKERIIRLISTPIDSEEGALERVTMLRDITKEWEVDRMKSEFLSTVSHELRTPLTSIIGFAKIIRRKFSRVLVPSIERGDRKVDRALEQVKDNLDIIVEEGDRLTSLINDFLDLSKIEAGKIEWKPRQVEVIHLLDRAAHSIDTLARRKGLTIENEVHDDLPTVRVDEDRMLQVVINLLSNAVKFTDRGSIVCRAERRDGEVLVSVEDSGVGIEKKDLERVFEKFGQVGDQLTEKPKGTGLGLPICKEIVEHHGGKLWVDSTVGLGTTFTFSIPLDPSGSRAERSERVG